MLRKTVHTVETLAHDAVSTAVSAARHPVGTAARAVGLVRGTVRAGRDLLHGGDETSYADTPVTDLPDHDDAGPIVPDPDDLPEPVVIEAEPEPAASEGQLPETGESFHTEPTAATRDSAHGETASDLEDAAGYVEEIPDPVEEAVWTSETPIASDGEPVLDMGIAHAVESEAAMMQKAADLHKE